MMAHFPPNPPFESFGLHGEAVRGTHARGLSVHACDVGLSTRIEDLAIALSACADETMMMTMLRDANAVILLVSGQFSDCATVSG